MSATVRYSAVRKMLKEHDPEFTDRTATHSRVITSKGRVYPKFPKYDEIEIGHIKKLVVALAVPADIAARHFPRIFADAKKQPSAGPPDSGKQRLN